MDHRLELKHRSTELHRRKAYLNRAIINVGGLTGEGADSDPANDGVGIEKPTTTSTKGSNPTTTVLNPNPTVPVVASTTSKGVAATISTTQGLSLPGLLPTTSSTSVTTSSTSLSTSLSTSTSSSSIKTSSSSSSSLTSSSSSSISSSAVDTTKASRTVATTTIVPSSSASSTAAVSNSASNSNSGGVSAGSIVGAIFGTIGGILVLAIVVAFVVRRLRARRNEEEHFDASQFRRSAALLDDEFGNDNFAARPPTMIARHMAHSPAIPPATYGNYPAADPYGGPEPYTPGTGGDPFNPPYNAYPNYTQEPVYSLNPGDTFPPANPIAHSMSAGSAQEMDPTTAHNAYLNRQLTLRETDTHPAQQYMDMNRVPSPPSSSMSHPAEYETGLMSPTSATPLQNPHPYHSPVEYPSVAPPAPAATHALAAAPAAVAANQAKRPETVYDPDDAYGGM